MCLIAPIGFPISNLLVSILHTSMLYLPKRVIRGLKSEKRCVYCLQSTFALLPVSRTYVTIHLGLLVCYRREEICLGGNLLIGAIQLFSTLVSPPRNKLLLSVICQQQYVITLRHTNKSLSLLLFSRKLHFELNIIKYRQIHGDCLGTLPFYCLTSVSAVHMYQAFFPCYKLRHQVISNLVDISGLAVI